MEGRALRTLPASGLRAASAAGTPAEKCVPRVEERVMSSVTTTYKISGMTCGHCEGAVSEEISRIEGVSAVKALAASGEVAVTSSGELDDTAVRDAVDEAGYELVGRA
ncbi:heavy-metal-associated domain-containing protein [Streptomyces sp. NPDC006925]|uniref:heavy-metal-associated domain-containing protein n=1 Tax=Streptomyces sp. NPDC006925 TaxID=3364768 RepID=UPI0036B618FD